MTQAQINQRREKGSQRVKPLLVKAAQVYELTIFDSYNKLRNARNHGNIVMVRNNGIWYDIGRLDPIFLKHDYKTNPA